MKELIVKDIRLVLYSILRQLQENETLCCNFLKENTSICISFGFAAETANYIQVMKEITKIRKNIDSTGSVVIIMSNGPSFFITKKNNFYVIDNYEIALRYMICEAMLFGMKKDISFVGRVDESILEGVKINFQNIQSKIDEDLGKSYVVTGRRYEFSFKVYEF